MTEITFAELTSTLAKAAKVVDQAVAPVVKATSERIAVTQRETVRRRSGKTADSIKATGPGGKPFGPKTIEGEIGPTWFVGLFLEHGTATQPPHPFVEQSAEPHMAAYAEDVTRAAAAGALKALS